jgi:hypothetical protein
VYIQNTAGPVIVNQVYLFKYWLTGGGGGVTIGVFTQDLNVRGYRKEPMLKEVGLIK